MDSGFIKEEKQSSEVANKQKQYQQFQLFNFDFHKQKKGCISDIIHRHITNWKGYQFGSVEINAFYTDMEQDHSYIQWIFPNFFQSNFNSDSYRLTIEERNKMISDKEVMDFYFDNYKMILRFFGIRWSVDNLEFENKDQFQICIQINTHNQLRLKRIFASLSVLGKRQEAIKLLNFIQKQDYQLYCEEYQRYNLLKEEEHNVQKQIIGNKQDTTQIQKVQVNFKSKDQIHSKPENTQKLQKQGYQKLSNQQQNMKKVTEVRQQQNFQQKSKISNKVIKTQKITTQQQQKSQNIEHVQNQKEQSQLTNHNQLIQENQTSILSWDQVKYKYVGQDQIDEKWAKIELLNKEIVQYL
ncbi:unnamed protein product [Paramecium sonneborni]|uniref:Opioid growth factor receptor (OGFr) conserved domain-containing protein n=1 Tax=Paramecium sonneborni TaxID=65129 RepID=A0A8S1RBX2_9CILI|nr:unnamed protein product [Paramecium sonneborni]